MNPTKFHDDLREIALTKGAQSASTFAVQHMVDKGIDPAIITHVQEIFSTTFDALNEAIRWTAFHENENHYISQL